MIARKKWLLMMLANGNGWKQLPLNKMQQVGQTTTTASGVAKTCLGDNRIILNHAWNTDSVYTTTSMSTTISSVTADSIIFACSNAMFGIGLCFELEQNEWYECAFTFSNGNNSYVFFYDENQQMVSSITRICHYFKMPGNAKYAVITFRTVSANGSTTVSGFKLQKATQKCAFDMSYIMNNASVTGEGNRLTYSYSNGIITAEATSAGSMNRILNFSLSNLSMPIPSLAARIIIDYDIVGGIPNSGNYLRALAYIANNTTKGGNAKYENNHINVMGSVTVENEQIIKLQIFVSYTGDMEIGDAATISNLTIWFE